MIHFDERLGIKGMTEIRILFSTFLQNAADSTRNGNVGRGLLS